MHRVIVIQFITLDGVVEDPDGADGTPFGGWAMRYGPEGVAGDKFRLGELMSTGVLLFGRRTWEHFATLWPGRTSPFADAMNDAAKAVALHGTADLSAWANSAAVDGDLADWVRRTLPERDIVVIGSGGVVSQLIADDLVDEYRLLVFPIAVGAGRRLFPDGAELVQRSCDAQGPGTLAVFGVEGRDH
jgi:dihydrofolate reductase